MLKDPSEYPIDENKSREELIRELAEIRSQLAAEKQGCRQTASSGAPDFKVLFEKAPGLYLVLDTDFHILAASDAYLEATRTTRAGILGNHLFDVFPANPESADAIRNTRASLNRVMQSRTADVMAIQRHDVPKPASEGGGFEVRYWSPVNSPVLNPDGSIAFIIHRVENVTDFVLLKQEGIEQARLTDELRERAVQMEADLYERSREVAEANFRLKHSNEELARLNEKAREIDELKSRFFANVSHELRTPLTLILGPVDRQIRRPDLAGETKADLMIVQRNARLLQRHVDNLLDIAKLEAGRMLMQYTRTDLASVTRLSASYFETVSIERDVRYEVHAPAELTAEVDREKVERMLFNLLSNAFKFTPDGGDIHLSLEAHAGHARIRVRDSGPGVPEPLRETIFDRFGQGEGGMERRYGGTGLGLAIVKEFALLHDGKVGVSEAPGGGAVFTLDLPLLAPAGTTVSAEAPGPEREAVHPAPVEFRPSPAPYSSRQPHGIKGPNILVVEDNPDMNAFLSDILGRHYRVTRAFNGEEGLKKALADSPDLILVDVMMPGMSGDRMIEEIRRHRPLDDVPIVILTAKADDALRLHMLKHGVQDYIHKPFSADEVIARVGGLLKKKYRLQHSEERYRTLFQSIGQGFCIIEMLFDAYGTPVDYRFLEANPAFEEQTGLHDAVGRRMRELAPSHEQHGFDIYGRIALTGEPERFVNKAAQLNRWFDVYAFRIGRPEERIVAVLFNDITERKRSEEALRESEERLRFALENSRVGAWELDPVDQTAHRSLEHDRIFGYSELLPEWTYDMFLSHVLPEDRHIVDEKFRQSISKNGEWNFECRIKRVDGAVRWIWAAGRQRFDERGNPRQMAGVVQDITERKQAEKALQESEKRFRTVFEQAAVGMGRVSFEDARWIEVNDIFCRMLGYSREELLETPWPQMTHPDDVNLDLNPFGRMAAGELDSYTIEKRFIHKQGHHVWARLTLSLVRDARGLPEYEIAVIEDISEHRRAEESLRRREEEFRALVENAPDVISLFDRDLRRIYVNSEVRENTGQDTSFMRGKSLTEAGYPDSFAHPLNAAIQHVFATGSAEVVELNYEALKGLIWLQIRCAPLRAADGSVEQVITIGRDITQLKRAEESLKESEERLRVAVEAADLGTWDLNLLTGKSVRSLRHDQMFGYQEPQTEWSLDLALRHMLPEDRRKVQEAHTPAPGKVAMQVEARFRRADGAIRWIMSTGRFHYDRLGHPVRIVGVCADITERKQAEEALKASLTEKEVMLKEIHHRVKNNMQVISSLISLQADEARDSSLENTFEELSRRVQSMAMVHEQLYQSVDLARIDFADYIENLLDYLWRAHGTTSGGIHLVLDLEPVALSVLSAVPCGLILNELVSNAIKHAFKGRSEGDVTVSLRSDADNRVLIQVLDNGIGLPAGFDWKQSPSLGLRLVQMLARQLRAEVEVSSDKGTEFAITFKDKDI